MSDKTAVTVVIYGNEYTLKGEADPKYIEELAKYVDVKMTEVGKKSSAPAAKVAILASMNIADELQRLEKARAEDLRIIAGLDKDLTESRMSYEGSVKHSLELKEQLEKTRSESVDYAKKAEAFRSEADMLKKNMESTVLKSQSLSVELGQARKDLETAYFESEELKRVKEDLAVLKPQVESLETSLLAERKNLESSEGERSRLKKEMEELTRRADETKTSLEKTRLDLETATSLLDESNRLVNELQPLKEQVSKLEASLKDQAAKLEASLTQEKERSAKEAEETARKISDKASSEERSLKTRIAQLESELAGEKEKAEKSAAESARLIQEAHSNTADSEDLVRLMEEMETLKSQRDQLKADLAGEAAKSDKARLDLGALKSETYALREKLENAEQELEKARKAAPAETAPVFIQPVEERVLNLFKRIDAILE